MQVSFKAFTDEQVKNIHEKTLEFIETHGVMLKHPVCAEIMQKNGATVDGEMVRVPKEITEKFLKTVPQRFKIVGRDRAKSVEIGVGLPYVAATTSSSVFVTEGDTKRLSTAEDWDNSIKLTQTSDVCGFLFPRVLEPNVPGDINERIYSEFSRALQMCDKPVINVTVTEDITKNTIEMARIAVQPQEGEDYYCMGVLNSNSPLMWDDNMAGAIYQHAMAGQPYAATCCSMAGFTSHVHIAETLLINNIEIVFGVILGQMIKPGLPCIYGNVTGAADLKTMNLSMASPDTLLISTCAAQMAKFYNMPVRTAGPLVDSKMLDSQCGMEAALSMMTARLNDVSFTLHGLGMLESFNSMSFEKWILDEEIINWTGYMFSKQIGELKEDVFDILLDIGYGGNYLYEESTMTDFREAFFDPTLADRLIYDTWKERGARTTEQAAREIWKKRVESYVEPTMNETTLSELEAFRNTL